MLQGIFVVATNAHPAQRMTTTARAKIWLKHYHQQGYTGNELVRMALQELQEEGYQTSYGFIRKLLYSRQEDIGLPQSQQKPEDEGKTYWDVGSDAAYWEHQGQRPIRTLDEALTFCQADLHTWEVDRYQFNSWDVTMKGDDGQPIKRTNYQVKVWFKKREEEHNLDQLLDQFANKLQNRTPFRGYVARPKGKQTMLEIDAFDPHFGKYANKEETNDPYDITIARERYEYAINKVIDRAFDDKVEQILFPTGNDWFHTDSYLHTTTKGTLQDQDLRWWEMWEHGIQINLQTIEFLGQKAPVHVIFVLSNHDWQNVYKMASVVRAYFKDHPGVTMDCRPVPRKYYRYGNVGLGFCHGNEEKHADLPNIMLRENQAEWADVKHMEWHLGHYHKNKRLEYKAADELNGINLRFLRSLSGADFWHHKNGYIGNLKGIEAFTWHKEEGLIANHPVTL
jgi:hypothetical protein